MNVTCLLEEHWKDSGHRNGHKYDLNFFSRAGELAGKMGLLSNVVTCVQSLGYTRW